MLQYSLEGFKFSGFQLVQSPSPGRHDGLNVRDSGGKRGQQVCSNSRHILPHVCLGCRVCTALSSDRILGRAYNFQLQWASTRDPFEAVVRGQLLGKTYSKIVLTHLAFCLRSAWNLKMLRHLPRRPLMVAALQTRRQEQEQPSLQVEREGQLG